MPRRVEDLIGGDPAEQGRRPLKSQTGLLRGRRAVGLTRNPGVSRAECKRASKFRGAHKGTEARRLAFGAPPIGGSGRRMRSGFRRTSGLA
jgi:hypothetical protein